MIRTPKGWDEPCANCHGLGTVHRREHFSLWTPEEYVRVMGGDFGVPEIKPEYKGADLVPANAIVCSSAPGAEIFESCREGVSLAKLLGRPVAFEFNDAVAVCHGDSDPSEAAKAWWLRAYGQTYEQSMRGR